MALIAAQTEDRQMYDQREKALRDYEWNMWRLRMRLTRREQGEEAKRRRGAKKGARRAKRRRGARKELMGIERGKLAGSIQTFQELLADTVSSDAELRNKSADELRCNWPISRNACKPSNVRARTEGRS